MAQSLAAPDEGHNAETAQPVEPQPVPVEPQPANAEEFPDWLKSHLPTEPVGDSPVNCRCQPVESEPAPDGPQPTSTGDFPDWINPCPRIQIRTSSRISSRSLRSTDDPLVKNPTHLTINETPSETPSYSSANACRTSASECGGCPGLV